MKPIHILIVEDNEGDLILTLEALNEGKVKNKISIARDGEEAINFVLNNNDKAELPDLILLDINLPKVDGKEVLDKIKSSKDHKSIPIVILTTSSAEKDILDSYAKNANSFITKPVDFEKFIDVVKNIEEYWISIVKLPTLANA